MEYMIKNFKHVVFEKYAAFEGRASRREFWYFILANFLISFILGFIEGIVTGAASMPRMSNDGSALSNVYSLLVFIPSIAVSARRLHDIDKSGWWMLVPLYNLYLFFQRGHEGPNRFDTPLATHSPVTTPAVVAEAPVTAPTTPEETTH